MQDDAPCTVCGGTSEWEDGEACSNSHSHPCWRVNHTGFPACRVTDAQPNSSACGWRWRASFHFLYYFHLIPPQAVLAFEGRRLQICFRITGGLVMIDLGGSLSGHAVVRRRTVEQSAEPFKVKECPTARRDCAMLTSDSPSPLLSSIVVGAPAGHARSSATKIQLVLKAFPPP